jgi:hypothetical protein
MITFTLKIYSSYDIPLSENGNVDVRIEMSDGRSFAATFFTVDNLVSLMNRYIESGECASGTYVWATDMIIVRSLSEENIRKSVTDLIATNEIEVACTRVPPITQQESHMQ